VDEPKDGLAKTHDSSFCAGQQEWKTGEPEDTRPVDLKRVTAEVSWVALHRSHKIIEVGTISSAGQEVGLAPTELKLASTTPATSGWEPTSPTITEASVTQLTFSVISPAGTSAMIWSLDGTTQSPAPTVKSGNEWTFSWAISSAVSDGTYQVAVQAQQANGTVGQAISIPVTLSRSIPAAPAGLNGGYNTVWTSGTEKKQVVELQWQPNSERNVIGYRVFAPAQPSGRGAEVCPGSPSTLSLADSCIDFNPPEMTAANLTYQVVALYRDAKGVVQEGPASSFTVVPFKQYKLAASEGNVGTNCTGASAKRDMLQNYTAGATDTTTSASTVFCSDAFAAGETIEGGGPLTAYFNNESPSTSCTITGELTLNGTQHGPEKIERVIPANTGVTKYEFPFSYSLLFEPGAGSRIDVLLTWGTGSGCNKTKLHYGSSTYPSGFHTAPKEAPKAPTSLEVKAQENGTAILKWVASSGGTPVSFYRIYRDGKLYSNRYDTSETVEYTDANHSSSHTYYVTAVNSALSESEFAGPVTG
jgi:hypothetical protein